MRSGPPVPTALGPRRRWWRHAVERLRHFAAEPVEVHLSAEHRIVDVMSIYALRIEIATGRLTGLMLEPKRGGVRRWPMRSPNISLAASPASSEVVDRIIRRDAETWAAESGSEALDSGTLSMLAHRLCRTIWKEWQKDGTLHRVRQRVAVAFQLEPVVVRLAHQIAAPRGGPYGANEGDYNRALTDRRALTILECDAPQLMPLLVEVFAQGQCRGEPLRALRHALLDRLGAPRHWRRFLSVPAPTLAWARSAPTTPLSGGLLDLATLIARVDSPIAPPLDWLQAHLNSCGDVHLMVGMDHQTRLKAVRAHLAAWEPADTQAKDQLLIELQIVHDWIDSQNPKAPQGLRAWSWWIRHALVWDQAQRLTTRAEQRPGHAAEARVLVMDDIEFRPILSAKDVYEEARAMANCLDRWRNRIVVGEAAAWSVRDRHTGRRIATAGVYDITDGSVQFKGFANRPLPPELALRLSQDAMALRRRRVDEAIDGRARNDGPRETGTTPEVADHAESGPRRASGSGMTYEEPTPDEKTAIDRLMAKGLIPMHGGLTVKPSPFNQRVSDCRIGGSLAWDWPVVALTAPVGTLAPPPCPARHCRWSRFLTRLTST